MRYEMLLCLFVKGVVSAVSTVLGQLQLFGSASLIFRCRVVATFTVAAR
jgi:hypothetical protein